MFVNLFKIKIILSILSSFGIFQWWEDTKDTGDKRQAVCIWKWTKLATLPMVVKPRQEVSGENNYFGDCPILLETECDRCIKISHENKKGNYNDCLYRHF